MTSPIILYLLNVFLLFVETSMAPLLASSFFQTRKAFSYSTLSFLIQTVLICLNSLLLDEQLLLRFFIGILIWAFWIYLNYNASFFKCFFIAVLLGSFHSAIDYVFVILANVFFNFDRLFYDPYAYYLLCYSAKLTELFIIICVHKLSRRYSRPSIASWLDWFRVLFFPFSSLLIAISLTVTLFQFPQLSGNLLFCSIILLISDFSSILLLNYIEHQQHDSVNKTVLIQNLKLESEHIASLKDAYASQRKQTHDFQNQLSVLRGLADRNAPRNEFSQYLDQILSIDFSSAPCINTSRPVVDVILSQKATVAHGKGICFQQKLENLADYPLPDDALVIILTNLIDNAIEACMQIENPDHRRILLKMQTTPEGAFLYLENTTAAPVVIHGNQIASTKSNPLTHGFGLKNVYAMLDRQHALYAIDYRAEDHTFRFSAKILN